MARRFTSLIFSGKPEMQKKFGVKEDGLPDGVHDDLESALILAGIRRPPIPPALATAAARDTGQAPSALAGSERSIRSAHRILRPACGLFESWPSSPALEDGQRGADDECRRGRLLIGSLETTAAVRLASLLGAYTRDFPEVELSLKTGTTCELIEAVREGSLDGAFVCGPVADASLDERAMFREELALIAPPGVDSVQALIARGDVRILVLRAGCSYRQRLEALLARLGVPQPRMLEFGTLEAISACVSAGLGITMLPVDSWRGPGRQAASRS